MAVIAIKEYVGASLDVEANFKGNRLIFVVWNKHLMYAAPFALAVPPSMSFREFLSERLGTVIANHPDAPHVDWSKVEWDKAGKPWQPDMDKSLAENGVMHKDCMRFTTPGLNGYKGLGI